MDKNGKPTSRPGLQRLAEALHDYAGQDAASRGQLLQTDGRTLDHYRLHAEPGSLSLKGGNVQIRYGDTTVGPEGIPSGVGFGEPSIQVHRISGSAHGSSVVTGTLTEVSPLGKDEIRGSLDGELLLGIEILTLGATVSDGQIIETVTLPWARLVAELEKDPGLLYRFDPRKMEELVAAAYKEAGEFDEVTLTPRSNDGGVDVVAVRQGQFSVRILDQVKRYRADHRVTADEVRALYGVLSRDPRASKAYITTTSEFAPGVAKEFSDAIPTRLDLRNGTALIDWFKHLARESS